MKNLHIHTDIGMDLLAKTGIVTYTSVGRLQPSQNMGKNINVYVSAIKWCITPATVLSSVMVDRQAPGYFRHNCHVTISVKIGQYFFMLKNTPLQRIN